MDKKTEAMTVHLSDKRTDSSDENHINPLRKDGIA